MRIWTGNVRLAGGRKKGPVVVARIAEDGDGVSVEVARGGDATGATRWERSSPRRLDPDDLCRLLVDAAGKAEDGRRA